MQKQTYNTQFNVETQDKKEKQKKKKEYIKNLPWQWGKHSGTLLAQRHTIVQHHTK
jgi:hypothetical protein